MRVDKSWEIMNNYRAGLENAIRANASEKSILILKYWHNRFIDLTHEPALQEEVLNMSKNLANLTDFSEENICTVMYSGNEEQMDCDYEDAVQIREILDYLL